MERITGLKWKKKEINCYVLKISEFYPFSDPLTIAIQLKYKDKITTLNVNRFIDILIHELIHNLFIENGINMHKYFQYLFKKYKNLSHRTVIHIPLYAVHKEIYLKFFSKKRLEYDIKIAQKRSDYKNAWDIVLKEGSKKIITGLKNIEKYHKLYF
ncbi:MAG: hypothetical protein KKD48_00900 [Nanoarchaeota archaeon]|nr:hypothetical protein [Nanoarchaeota archaeon]